jgi:HNH endonuclease
MMRDKFYSTSPHKSSADSDRPDENRDDAGRDAFAKKIAEIRREEDAFLDEDDALLAELDVELAKPKRPGEIDWDAELNKVANGDDDALLAPDDGAPEDVVPEPLNEDARAKIAATIEIAKPKREEIYWLSQNAYRDDDKSEFFAEQAKLLQFSNERGALRAAYKADALLKKWQGNYEKARALYYEINDLFIKCQTLIDNQSDYIKNSYKWNFFGSAATDVPVIDYHLEHIKICAERANEAVSCDCPDGDFEGKKEKSPNIFPHTKSLKSREKQRNGENGFRESKKHLVSGDANESSPKSSPFLKVTLDRFHNLFIYHPFTGQFERRVAAGNQPAGAIAGSVGPDGYVRIRIDGVDHLAHRLAYLPMTGSFPPDDLEVDHRDHNKENNAWNNLRLVPPSQNSANTAPKNFDKIKGVFFDKQKNKHRAILKKEGKFYRSKWFDTEEEAIAARKKVEETHQGEFAYKR